MPDALNPDLNPSQYPGQSAQQAPSSHPGGYAASVANAPMESRYAFGQLLQVVSRRRWLFWSTVLLLPALCLAYCLVVPSQYESTAEIALRIQPPTSLSMAAAEAVVPTSILSTPLQLETIANVFRSDRLAWRVLTELKLYQNSAFSRAFLRRFPHYRIETRDPAAEAYLLDTFHKKVHAQSIPRTLLVEIRFRTHDPRLSALVVNTLIDDYIAQERETREQANMLASDWLTGQLAQIRAKADRDDKRLVAFERAHGILASAAASLAADHPIAGGAQSGDLQAIDEIGRQLAVATGDRMLRDALYRQAQEGMPEQVLAANPELAEEMGGAQMPFLNELKARRLNLTQELAQLSIEHGPNYPRVVEIAHQLADIDQQAKAQQASLVEGFHRALLVAQSREEMLRAELDRRTAAGLEQDDAAIQYAVLMQQALASRELYVGVQRKLQEAALAAGVQTASIVVVDPARRQVKPVTPDTPLYLGIALVVGLWLALALVFAAEGLRRGSAGASKQLATALVLLAISLAAHAQAPTPNTSGLPSGVGHPLGDPLPQQTLPDAKTAPSVWTGPLAQPGQAGPLPGQSFPGATNAAGSPVPLPIAPGDLLDISEFHTPELRSAARVTAAGTVILPLAGEVRIAGLYEQDAAHAIEKALLDKGMLTHPLVTVLVVSYVGEDVTVLGEVARPGVYPYTAHHRLLDLLSAAQGLGPNAGRLVSVYHRDSPHTPHPVILDPAGMDTGGMDRAGKADKADHNPELAPGDTVEVSRAGLVYVIGDVVRPGGFPVDPVQGLTVVQALSLAWGASPNAATGKAILIRNQEGGRTLTALDLKKMIRGTAPDIPIHDRDILFVPDSPAKNLWNKGLESAIQSTVGVAIYAGLVYSQRF